MKSIYFGVVENRFDPLMLGRCQVRIVGVHTEDKVILPTSDLAWAMPMQPITSAGISGIGMAPVGVVEGTWVVLCFLDENFQYPMMIGTIGGYNENLPFEFDNQKTTNSVKEYDAVLSTKPANEGDDKKDAGGLETVVPLDKILGALPPIDMPAVDVAAAFASVKDDAMKALPKPVLPEIALPSAEELSAKFSSAQDALTSKMTAAADKLKAAASNGTEGLFANAKKAATGVVTKLTDTASGLLTTAVASATAMVNNTITTAKAAYTKLAQMSESINVDSMMNEINIVTTQAGSIAQTGVDNALTLISTGTMKLSDLKTEAEKQDVIKLIQDKVTDLPENVQSYIMASGASIEEQYNIIKQFAENGTSMYSEPEKEFKMVVTSTTSKTMTAAEINAEYEANIKAGV